MLHWNSLWAPTELGGKSELETAPVWKEPWPAEQMMAWQTMAWEQMLNSTHAFWSLCTAVWSMPMWMLQGMGDAAPSAANDESMPEPEPEPDTRPDAQADADVDVSPNPYPDALPTEPATPSRRGTRAR